VIRPSTRGTTPTIARSSVVLPAPDDPDEGPAPDGQVDVTKDGRSVVAARDTLEPDEGVAQVVAGGPSARGGRR
jgi:hypothetical protein